MAPRDDRIDLIQALAVTAELTGTQLSDAAARMMAEDLSAYPLAQVLVALTRCRRELKGRLTIASVIERLDDGRPGPEEAWAMVPKDEAGSVVWTSEMAEAFGVAAPLLHDGDSIAARMAFRESYAAIVTRARAERAPVRWIPSLGHDKGGRAPAIEEALRKGRITADFAARLLPPPAQSNVVALLEDRTDIPEDMRQRLRDFTKRVTRKG